MGVVTLTINLCRASPRVDSNGNIPHNGARLGAAALTAKLCCCSPCVDSHSNTSLCPLLIPLPPNP
eukprot:332868-Chlamydomonas_euryale.AAC.1